MVLCARLTTGGSIILLPIETTPNPFFSALSKASKNNVAIAIGLEDYTADIGIERTNDGQESLFARCQLINAARSAGIQAIDTVFSDVNDENALRNSTKEAKQLGFDHPTSNERLEFSSNIPSELNNIIKKLRKLSK